MKVCRCLSFTRQGMQEVRFLVNIDELNKQIKACYKCRLAESRLNVLCGEGNMQARVMLVAQAPGEAEDRDGRMFIGPSGRVLDDLLSANQVNRRELYITNLVKCMLPKYRKPKQDEIQACTEWLDKEIQLINPDVLVSLGYYATRYIFEKHALPCPSKKEFCSVTGRLVLAARVKILPLSHPAVVLHQPHLKGRLTKNYAMLKTLMKECCWFPVCPVKRYTDQGLLDRSWSELFCLGDWKNCIRYQMEDKGKPHADWMLPDGSISNNLKNGLAHNSAYIPHKND